MIRSASLLLLTALLAGACPPAADAKLHALFTDGVVLQRGVPCPVWGSSAPGDRISVSLAGRTKSVKTDADGRWSVRFDPMDAGGPYELKVNQTVVRDVMIGEVWVAAGGSNMELPLKSALIAKTEPDEGPVSMVRFFVLPVRESSEPQRDVAASWKTGRSETVSDVSAVGYFFARELQRRLKVAVGVIQASAPDSTAEKWISKGGFASDRDLREFTVLNSMALSNYRGANARYLESLRKAEEARKRGDPLPRVLPKPLPPFQQSELYNGMIAPLMPFAVKGVIWYQGEPDYFHGMTYRKLLGGLIKDWRQQWALGEFPFGYVQYANYGNRREQPEDTALPRFREAQRLTLQLPNTGMVVAVDIGDPRDERPRNKEEVSRRLALWAEARAYGKSDLVYSGPLFDSMKIEGNKIRILFKNAGSGLKMAGDSLKGFALASEFRHFAWANAMIDGNSVVVWCDEVKWPAAVRYGWDDNPECTLFNQEGLPASPFRTDTW
jgi:sialate O-acetylesterase